MRLFAIVVSAILLTASWVVAGVPAGALSPLEKVPAQKENLWFGPAGMLDCSGATEISLNNTYTGDNTGIPSNVSMYSCNPWYEPGGEVVFHLFLAGPAMFEASIEAGCDLDLAVLDQCDEDLGCLSIGDTGVVTDVPVSGDIYLVVDGYGEEGCPFTLTVTELPLPPAKTFCDLVEVLAGSGYFDGYTCGNENLVSSLDCSATPAEGLEAYYVVVMTPGSSFTATVTHQGDAALWVLGTCVEPFTCLAYADAGLGGDPEVISYANTSTETITVYLVVDSYGPGTCGVYDMEYTYEPGQVPAKSMTFGAIKSLYSDE